MIIVNEIEDFPKINGKIALTIGNYDGVHRGHQIILKKLKSKSDTAIILTFENHPTQILKPEQATKPIYHPPLKLDIFRELGIDGVLMLKFTKEFSQQTPKEFLERLHKAVPFEHLILGHDAVIGKGRAGNREVVEKLADEMGFTVEYIDQHRVDGEPVSSSIIRKGIREGKIILISQLLGRPYSISGKVIKGLQKGTRIGYPTANIEVYDLCLPPYGVYAIKLKHKGKMYHGVANLGVAPTVREDPKPLLESFLFEEPPELYHEEVEVFPIHYIREERKFKDIDELKEQISKDIEVAKEALRP